MAHANTFPRIAAVVVALGLLVSPLAANAAQAWLTQAEDLFQKDEYERTVELVKPHADGGDLDASMFLMFANLQLYHYTKAKYYNTRYKGLLELVEAKAGLDELPRILYFGNQTDKPEVVKSARKVAKKVISALFRTEDVPKLLGYANSKDEDIRKLAYGAIDRILGNARKVVDKGGNLRAKDIEVMQDPKLIKALLNDIELSDAFGSLVSIEEPVLPYLSGVTSPKGVKLEQRIQKAINKRQKKFPTSNWKSATGKTG